MTQFPFVIGSLPLLTMDATIGNQAFSQAQVEYTLKVMERAEVTCY